VDERETVRKPYFVKLIVARGLRISGITHKMVKKEFSKDGHNGLGKFREVWQVQSIIEREK
jgi:hypothetical protein